MTIFDPADWFEKHYSTFSSFTTTLNQLIRSILIERNIPFASVESRTKTKDSFLKKVEKKGYSNGERMTDFSGVRIICYLENEVRSVLKAIQDSFEVIREHSLDKADSLSIDRVGYKSIHCVARLTKYRTTLPEFSRFQGISFEVQIRTVLQHAWAEIEHDRIYKLPINISKDFKRRFNLISGLLEIADREFSSLAIEMEDYIANQNHELSEVSDSLYLDSNTLQRFLLGKWFKDIMDINISMASKAESLDVVIEELERFGIKNIGDLKGLLTERFVEAFQDCNHESTDTCLCRDAMMFFDLHRYFAEAWNNNWGGTEFSTIGFLAKKYPRQEVFAVFEEYSIDILDDHWADEP